MIDSGFGYKFVCGNSTFYWSLSEGKSNNCGVKVLTDIRITSENPGAVSSTQYYPVSSGARKVTDRVALNAFYEHLYNLIQADPIAQSTWTGKTIIMAAPVDFQAPAVGLGKSDNCTVTHDFANWLISVKKELVVASPVFANINYGGDPASLNQVWVWIPKVAVDQGRILPDTSGIFNEPDSAEAHVKFANFANPYINKFEDQFSEINDVSIRRFAKAKSAWEFERNKISLRRKSVRWVVNKSRAICGGPEPQVV